MFDKSGEKPIFFKANKFYKYQIHKQYIHTVHNIIYEQQNENKNKNKNKNVVFNSILIDAENYHNLCIEMQIVFENGEKKKKEEEEENIENPKANGKK